MLNNISWLQYWLAIALLSLFYYLFIWVVFYKGSFSFLKVSSPSTSKYGNDAIGTDVSDIFLITEDLKPVFLNKTNKTELMLALEEKIQSYYEIIEPGFRDTLNRFLISESQNKCSIRLDDDDLRALWK